MTISHRVKSFFINFGSILLASFTTLIFTPQWSEFIVWAHDRFNSYLLGLGTPTAVIIILGLFVAEVWRGLLNSYLADKHGFSNVKTLKANMPHVETY